jgi:IS30 family transposase
MQNTKKQRRSFRHLNQGDRDRIEALLLAGHNQKEIAIVLKVSTSCISRELKRKKKNGDYTSTDANRKALVKRANSKYQGMKIEQNEELQQRIIDELKQKRSPDEIAGRLKAENSVHAISTKSIYRWLYSSCAQRYCKYLCHKRYKKKKQKHLPKREMIPNVKTIEERPFEGMHAEGDLFVSPTRHKTTKSGFLTVIPQTMLYTGTFVKNRSPKTMIITMNNVTQKLPIDTITLDRGVENRYHEQFNTSAYFCDAHSPWQKPYVESGIGLLRKWFIPKGTNLATVSEEKYQSYLNMLNHKYRKSLGYKSAYEVSLEQGIIQKIPPRVRWES